MNIGNVGNEFDPFNNSTENESKSNLKIHLRIQQRNARKSITIVEGLPEGINLKKLLKALRKQFCCNGNINAEKHVMQLQGDQRDNVSQFLIENKLASQDNIVMHGF